MLPLISHKAAANRTEALRVLPPRATSTLLSWGLAPLGANLEGPFCGCAPMSDDQEIQSDVTNGIDMDEAF
jgi:hypothetical protein